jgi:hypothetical protein
VRRLIATVTVMSVLLFGSMAHGLTYHDATWSGTGTCGYPGESNWMNAVDGDDTTYGTWGDGASGNCDLDFTPQVDVIGVEFDYEVMTTSGSLAYTYIQTKSPFLQTNVTLDVSVLGRQTVVKSFASKTADQIRITTPTGAIVRFYEIRLVVPDPPLAPPGAPGTLTVSSITETTAVLGWGISSGVVDEYVVYLDGDEVHRTTNLTYTLTGLTASTTYDVMITAENDGGQNESPTSNIVDFDTADPPPPPPPPPPPIIDIAEVTQAATNGGAGLLLAASGSFTSLWPYILGLTAAVYIAFWILARVKKGASGAR